MKVDPAPCLAAAATNDDDRIIAACGPPIDNAKTAKADRLKALLARGAAYDRKDMLDSAIAGTITARRQTIWMRLTTSSLSAWQPLLLRACCGG